MKIRDYIYDCFEFPKVNTNWFDRLMLRYVKWKLERMGPIDHAFICLELPWFAFCTRRKIQKSLDGEYYLDAWLYKKIINDADTKLLYYLDCMIPGAELRIEWIDQILDNHNRSTK